MRRHAMTGHELKKGDKVQCKGQVSIGELVVQAPSFVTDYGVELVPCLIPHGRVELFSVADLKPLPPEPNLPAEGTIWLKKADGDYFHARCVPPPDPENWRKIDIAEHLRNKEIVAAIQEGYWPKLSFSWQWWYDNVPVTSRYHLFADATTEMLKLRQQRKGAGR